MVLWEIWWVWVAIALVLGILEVFTAGFIFVGFAIGAALVGLLLALGAALSLAVLLVIFAVFSVIAWLVLRRIFGVRRGQRQTFHRDINED